MNDPDCRAVNGHGYIPLHRVIPRGAVVGALILLQIRIRGLVYACTDEARSRPYRTAIFLIAPAVALVLIQLLTGWPPDVR